MSQGMEPVAARGLLARRRAASRRAARRSAVLTLLSTLVPGAGLLRTRYHRFGLVLLAVVLLATLVTAGLLLLRGPSALLLPVVLDPNALLVAALAAVAGGMLWTFAIILTHRGTLDPILDRGQRIGLRVLTAVACLALVVPLGTAVRYALIQRGVLSSLFTERRTATAGDSPDRPHAGPDPWEGVERVNVLLLGTDADADHVGVRTDSMIVASIEPRTGEVLLFGLPRNLQNVPFPPANPLAKLWPRGYTCGSDCLLNGVWTEATNHKELFKNDRNPGLTTTRGVIEEITGLQMDYTVVVGIDGFRMLVDAMGGVVVHVAEDLPIGGHLGADGRLTGVVEWIRPGIQRLDGFHALWFARSRYSTDDYSRMRRQRCVIGSVLDQLDPGMIVTAYPQFAAAASDNVDTDIPVADLSAWVELVRRIQGGRIRSLPFTDRNISPGNPDFAAIRRMIRVAVHPELATPTATPSATTRPGSTTKPGATTRTTRPTTTSAPTTSTLDTSDSLVDLADAC